MIIAIIVIVFIIVGKSRLWHPWERMVEERDSIAKEICDLGSGYSQILHVGWVSYLVQINAAGEAGQSAGRA